MIDWVESELRAWGEYAARIEDGAGYPRQSAFVRGDSPSGGIVRDQVWDRITADYSRIESAIQRLTPPTTRLIVIRHYKTGAGVRKTARLLDIHNRSVTRHRDAAHVQIAQMYADAQKR